MLKLKLKLHRPLAVFDIEATGISPRADRIVELAVVKLMPDNKRRTYHWLVNPGMPIPKDATAVHKISDADVANAPRFSDIAADIMAVFEDCDLCGYNILRFDIPMLTEEFLRSGMDFKLDDRRVIDPQRIYHQREPRDLSAALAFYCNELHIGAHGAEADVLATIRVLEGQYGKYQDLPTDINVLNDYCNPKDPSWADRTGKLKWVNNEICLNFGRKKGELLRNIVRDDPNFVKWLLRSDFPRDTREIVANAADGKWPTKPDSTE
ncbi:MAG: 3'-5' exonuclease [Lentisphaerae bacterium]|nr:3'-5' exonuclease [Lentisphaerota bacterium]